jgi:hypothetical protein
VVPTLSWQPTAEEALQADPKSSLALPMARAALKRRTSQRKHATEKAAERAKQRSAVLMQTLEPLVLDYFQARPTTHGNDRVAKKILPDLPEEMRFTVSAIGKRIGIIREKLGIPSQKVRRVRRIERT